MVITQRYVFREIEEEYFFWIGNEGSTSKCNILSFFFSFFYFSNMVLVLGEFFFEGFTKVDDDMGMYVEASLEIISCSGVKVGMMVWWVVRAGKA